MFSLHTCWNQCCAWSSSAFHKALWCWDALLTDSATLKIIHGIQKGSGMLTWFQLCVRHTVLKSSPCGPYFTSIFLNLCWQFLHAQIQRLGWGSSEGCESPCLWDLVCPMKCSGLIIIFKINPIVPHYHALILLILCRGRRPQRQNTLYHLVR